MIGSASSNKAADITALAMRASNLKAGVGGPSAISGAAASTSATTSSNKASSTDRGPAALTDERTLQLAQTIARQQASSDAVDGGSSATSTQRASSGARQEMLESATSVYSGLLFERSSIEETTRLYAETGKVVDVQPNGKFEVSAEGLEP